MQEKEMVGERKLWAAVVSSGKKELRSQDDQEVLKAALYFFSESDGEDHILTFNGVCRAHNVDPNKAAKRIWEKLKPSRQQRIKNLIRESGYESRVH